MTANSLNQVMNLRQEAADFLGVASDSAWTGSKPFKTVKSRPNPCKAEPVSVEFQGPERAVNLGGLTMFRRS